MKRMIINVLYSVFFLSILVLCNVLKHKFSFQIMLTGVFMVSLITYIHSSGKLNGFYGVKAGLVISSMILSLAAMSNLRINPSFSLILFCFSGYLLFYSLFDDKLSTLGEIPERKLNAKKSEIFFFVLLLIYAFLSRFYDLRGIPAGLYGIENLQIGVLAGLDKPGTKYLWHLGTGAEWPTMTLYQSLFFMDVFGWNAGSMRMSGAFWGVMLIISFYFMARTLFSPQAALISSVLLASNPALIGFSRSLSPTMIMYTSIIMSVWLFVQALRGKNNLLYMLSGLLLGFTLHGYMAGRILPAVLGALAVFVFFFRRNYGFSVLNILFMLAGFTLSAGPIFYFAYKNPDLYWAYLRTIDSNRSTGLTGYVSTFLSNIKHYIGAFHIKGDCTPVFQYPGNPMVDAFTGFIFPAGLVVIILTINTPVSFFLGTFLLFGMLPSMLGSGGTGHPSLPRMLGAIPAVYLIAAMVIDRIFNALEAHKNRKLNYSLFVILLIISVFYAYKGTDEFFNKMLNTRGYKAMTDYGRFIAMDEMEKYPDTKIHRFQRDYFSFEPKLKKNSDYYRVSWPEEFLILDPERDNLLILDTYLHAYEGFFKENFPNAIITKKTAKNEISFEKCGPMMAFDPAAPDVAAFIVRIPKNNAVNFQKMFLNGGDKVSINSNELALSSAGKSIKLEGAVIIKESDVNSKIQINWKGFELKINGLKSDTGVISAKGINYITLSGVVPGSMPGKNVFDVIIDGKPEKNRVVALKDMTGLSIEFYQSFSDIKSNQPVCRRNSIFPAARIYYAVGSSGFSCDLKVPFYTVLKGKIVSDSDSSAYLSIAAPSKSQIYVDNTLVYDNISSAFNTEKKYVNMKSGKEYFVKIVGLAEKDFHYMTFILNSTKIDSEQTDYLRYETVLMY